MRIIPSPSTVVLCNLECILTFYGHSFMITELHTFIRENEQFVNKSKYEIGLQIKSISRAIANSIGLKEQSGNTTAVQSSRR